MFRSALVALKPGDANAAVLEYALSQASKNHLYLAGAAVLDPEREAPAEPVPLGAAAFQAHRNEARLKELKEQIAQLAENFTRRSREAGVTCEFVTHTSDLVSDIAHLVQRFDLLFVGHTAGTTVSGRPSETTALHEVLRQTPRPAIVVPAVAPVSNTVLVAYDGSLQAARALQAYAACGWYQKAHTICLAYGEVVGEARRNADLAAEYLRRHGMEVDVAAEFNKPSIGERILADVAQRGADLLVMGAYGKPTWREFFFGSITRQVLQSIAVPVFLDH